MDLEEKALGIDATNWLKEKLEGAIKGDDELVIRTELKVAWVSMVGCLVGYMLAMVWYHSNEQMITEGYAGNMMEAQRRKTSKN